MRRTLAAAAVLGTVGTLSACGAGSGGGATPAPSETGATSSAAVSPAPTDGPSDATTIPSPSSLATLPAKECLTGRYALVRFVAVGGQTYGTGQGGDVVITFDDGRYTLAGSGQKPVVVTVGGQTGDLTVNGETKGTYRLSDDTATFDETSATGSGTLSAATGGDEQQLTMKQVAKVVGLAGDGEVACTDQAMTITLSSVRLELGRA